MKPARAIGDVAISLAASAEQITVARELFREYQLQLGVDLCFQGFDEELRDLPGEYAPPRGRLLLATVGTEFAGCVALRPVDPRRAEMKRLFVRPAFQGLGLGRSLVDRLVAEARSLGYGEVVLDTLPQMGAAQRLYESLGFRDIEPYRFNPVAGSRYLGLRLDIPANRSPAAR